MTAWVTRQERKEGRLAVYEMVCDDCPQLLSRMMMVYVRESC